MAQQSRVDSVIHLLNKSIINNKLDTANVVAAFELLATASLTDSHINQIEIASLKFDSLKHYSTSFSIRLTVLNRILNTDAGKAISYGKLQIEKIDKLPHSELSGIKARYLGLLRIPFRNTNRLEDGFKYYTQKLNDYKIRKDSLGISQCYFVLGGFYKTSGLLDLAIYNAKKSISYLDTVSQKGGWINHNSNIASYYLSKGDLNESLKHYRLVLKEKTKSRFQTFYTAIGMASVFIEANQLDSAAYYINLAKSDTSHFPDANRVALLQIESLHKIHSGALKEAENLLKECWQMIIKSNIPADAAAGIMAPDYYLALVRIKQNKFDEAIALLSSDIERLLNNRIDILRDYKLMADLYKKIGNNDKAAETYAIFIAKQDSLLADQDKYRSFSFEAEQQINEKELSIAKLESQNRISSLTRNFSIGMAALLLLLVAGVYYRFHSKKKANEVLEKTLSDLKATQSQLIQSEKMASLGELTAGIAHEIQNPLNFVNNFSEVNSELVSELEEAANKGNLEEVKSIAKGIKDNEQKIVHHGKRADAIVKGMLQHSRTSSGQKELTDINALCDEYLRLAYHGLRAKDKSFNATMKTKFEGGLEKINVIPQDIGRVILNLITNAFYATTLRQARLPDGQAQGDTDYEPTVIVSTKKSGDKVLISVKDNGNGISHSIVEKIFQPFFTTKPTGQGTGLGLSLSYDIVKAHRGELYVETKHIEGLPAGAEAEAGSEFMIQLPIV